MNFALSIKGVGIIVRHRGKILLVKRKDNGQWGLPGGKIENGEKSWQAALRELSEETGLVSTKTKFLGVSFCPARKDKEGSKDGLSAGFIVDFPNKEDLVVTLAARELGEFKWVAADKAFEEKPFYPSSAETIGLYLSTVKK
jgi:8-oxo-dGTP pyrophosphatase MutT (NUDIX family)